MAKWCACGCGCHTFRDVCVCMLVYYIHLDNVLIFKSFIWTIYSADFDCGTTMLCDIIPWVSSYLVFFFLFLSLHCVFQFRLLFTWQQMYANNNDKWLKQTNLLKYMRRTNLHCKCKQIKSILKTSFMHANSIFQPKWYQMKYCVYHNFFWLIYL